jgi:hypothetical protein
VASLGAAYKSEADFVAPAVVELCYARRGVAAIAAAFSRVPPFLG